MPNVASPGTNNYNYEIIRPTEKLTANQPAVRVDYQPTSSLRATFKYSGWSQKNQVINGSLPGFNDTQQYKPVVSTLAATVNYTFNPTTFLEATYGHSQNELTGLRSRPGRHRSDVLPERFRDEPARKPIQRRAGEASRSCSRMRTSSIRATTRTRRSAASARRISSTAASSCRPSFTWGSRVSNANPNYAPPNTPFPGFLNINATDDVSISLTKVWGRHTVQERVLQHTQLQGAAARRLERHDHVLQRQQQPH